MKSTRRRFNFLWAVPPALAVLAASTDASAARDLQDYRYFRALSIDLAGRMPTLDEINAFEKDDFDVNAWIDARLSEEDYAARLRRIYMDLMRLEVGNSFRFVPGLTTLRRKTIIGPDGNPLHVYFREGQRRQRPETDNTFCLTPDETGFNSFPKNTEPTGAGKAITQATLDKYTKVVKPWWLYRDYKGQSPSDLYDATSWAQSHPGYTPVQALYQINGTPITSIRVCNEETQANKTGTVFAPGRVNPPDPAYKRVSSYTTDSRFAKAMKGQEVSCLSGTALNNSDECGCGVGLEWCMPGASAGNDPQAFMLPTNAPIGYDMPFDSTSLAQSYWSRQWWSEEFIHFFDDIIKNDRDFREVLTSKATFVNGPLAQFYKSLGPSTCCGSGAPSFSGDAKQFYSESVPLFDPANLPANLPHDVTSWTRVDDRGPLASGIMTMPIFLTKYGSRRAKAHVLYNVFLCREFVSPTTKLLPSDEPNLMKRQGCADCHATLEPLSAYFSRIVESDWSYLPKDHFPVDTAACKLNDNGDATVASGLSSAIASSDCNKYYDKAFSSKDSMRLRGAYGSPENVDAGPGAFAQEIVASADFPSCVARNVATSFLGRTLTSDDAELQTMLSDELVSSSYSMRSLVRALVLSDAYKKANNMSSDVWRAGGEP